MNYLDKYDNFVMKKCLDTRRVNTFELNNLANGRVTKSHFGGYVAQKPLSTKDLVIVLHSKGVLNKIITKGLVGKPMLQFGPQANGFITEIANILNKQGKSISNLQQLPSSELLKLPSLTLAEINALPLPIYREQNPPPDYATLFPPVINTPRPSDYATSFPPVINTPRPTTRKWSFASLNRAIATIPKTLHELDTFMGIETTPLAGTDYSVIGSPFIEEPNPLEDAYDESDSEPDNEPASDSDEEPASDTDDGTEPDNEPKYQLSAEGFAEARKNILQEDRLDRLHHQLKVDMNSLGRGPY